MFKQSAVPIGAILPRGHFLEALQILPLTSYCALLLAYPFFSLHVGSLQHSHGVIFNKLKTDFPG